MKGEDANKNKKQPAQQMKKKKERKHTKEKQTVSKAGIEGTICLVMSMKIHTNVVFAQREISGEILGKLMEQKSNS